MAKKIRTWKTHKCPACGKVYKELGAFETHMRNEHPGEIPAGWSIRRYVYFLHLGKTAGVCRVCGSPTGWNEATCKYVRMCDNPACRKAYRDKFMADMRARKKDPPTMDPEAREKMLMNRRISGEYTFQDGGKVGYMGKLERGFLEMLDKFFRFPSADILGPSPNRYVYYYDNPKEPDQKGEHSYIPDFYIPSINLEIELKSSQNARPANLDVGCVKDAFKDVRMIRDPSVNYVKIYEEDYHVFFQVFADLASQVETGQRAPIKYISRALLTSIYLNYIPEDCLKLIKKYIYKYSEKAAMKAIQPVTEGDFPYELGEIPVIPAMEAEIAEPEPPSLLDIYDAEIAEENAETEEEARMESVETSIGMDPYIFYELNETFTEEDRTTAMEHLAQLFSMPGDFEMVLEAMKGTEIDTNTVAGRAAVAHQSWHEKIFRGKAGKKFASKLFTKVEMVNNQITISGINCNLLVYRLKEYYEESRLKYMFEYTYNAASLKKFNAKKIGRGDMKIDKVHCPAFFALELVTLFNDLAERYRDNSYKIIAETIYQNSWLAQSDVIQKPDVSLEPLKNLDMELLPHQTEFIKNWDRLKSQLNMNGYILAFQPGKGKTLTAIGLSECIKASKVYIVCPNNLKDNWALEIRKYYQKYATNEALWKQDVCILGDAKFGKSVNSAKYIIANNESIKLMTQVVHNDPQAMLILDESHNFRNYTGTRSEELFKMADKLGSKNVLCMSATPIKAAPSEITPVLRLIDPTFTDDAAKMYSKCFALNDVAAMHIVERRFGMIMWRPDIEVKLPPKTTSEIMFTVPNENRYYMNEVHDEIVARFKELHGAWLQSVQGQLTDFEDSIRKFSLKDKITTTQYIEYVFDSMNSLKGEVAHELSVKEYQTFIDDYIRPNKNCPPMEAERLLKMEKAFIIAAKSHMGKAVGEILPPRRNEMYIALYEAGKSAIQDMILQRSKKTVIFSTMVPVVKYIANDLAKSGIKTVMVTGEVGNRLALLTQFKEDQQTMVLVATSQTLGVGLTLTEASQMFFFGTPWRSTDYEQACDRIWRIGQTDAVNIWTVMMQSRAKNLSTRMQDILNWSDRMFNAAISPTAISGEPETPNPATEGFGEMDSQFVYRPYLDLHDIFSGYTYGYHVNGQLLSEDDCDPSTDYTTMTATEFEKLKGGTCFDYCYYTYQYLKNRGIKSDCYYIWFGEDECCHSFNVSVCNGRYIWVEGAWKQKGGVYAADHIEDIFQYIIDHTPLQHKDSYKKTLIFKIRNIHQLAGRKLGDYVESLIDKGSLIRYTPKPPTGKMILENISAITGHTSAMEASLVHFDPSIYSKYYHITSGHEMKLITSVYESYIAASKLPCRNIQSDEQFGYERFHIYLPKSALGTHILYNEWDSCLTVAEALIHDGFDGFLFIMEVTNWQSVSHWVSPVIAIPALNGAFIINPGMDARAGLYFDTSCRQFPSYFFAGWCKEHDCFNRKMGGKIHCYMVSLRYAADLAHQFEKISDFIARCKSDEKAYVVDYDPMTERLHGVEVLRHGAILSRNV